MVQPTLYSAASLCDTAQLTIAFREKDDNHRIDTAVSIEVTLDESEKRILRSMATMRSIRLSGLVELQVLLEALDVSEGWTRFLLEHHFAGWFDSGFGRHFSYGKRSLSFPGDPPVLPEDASEDDRKYHETQKREYEEAKRAHDAAEGIGNSTEKKVNFLERLGFLHVESAPAWVLGFGGQKKEPWVQITRQGLELTSRIADDRLLVVRRRSASRDSVFVASAFGRSDTDELFETVLEPTCAQVGLQAVRVDLSEPESTITEAILRGVQTAECVIADLTYARPSVYFEAGFGAGLGVPLLLTCREDHQRGAADSERVHFDLEQYKISFWKRGADGSFLWSKKMDPETRLKGLTGRHEVHPSA